MKSAKTRNRDNPISHKWCGRRGGYSDFEARTRRCFLRIFVLFYFFPLFGFDGLRAVAAASSVRASPRDITYGSRTVVFSHRTPTHIDVTLGFIMSKKFEPTRQGIRVDKSYFGDPLKSVFSVYRFNSTLLPRDTELPFFIGFIPILA